MPGPERMLSTLAPVTVPVGCLRLRRGQVDDRLLDRDHRDSVAGRPQPKLVALDAEGGRALECREVRCSCSMTPSGASQNRIVDPSGSMAMLLSSTLYPAK